jgi:predicted membrane protein
MSLLYLILVLAVTGFALWAMNTYVPMDPKIKRAINIIVIVAVCIWVLKTLGVIEYLKAITI